MSTNDTYRTLTRASNESLYKEKGSKFYGYAFPVHSEEDVTNYLDAIKSKHHAARHWCYAWQLGEKQLTFRVNDDGEPRNSAGMPIYGQIQSFQITNVLVIVVRYFGGTKLGVGGLIQAYKKAAQMALEVSEIEERTIKIAYILKFDYALMNKVMRIIKEQQLDIVAQRSSLECEMEIQVRESNSTKIENILNDVYGLHLTKK
ncbi:IMPACT family protein [Flavobacteriaceae bacterium M23B6Z8]